MTNRVAIICLITSLTLQVVVGAEQLRVMSFNIWVGGESGKQPLSQTAEVIRAAKAEIVGMQEANGAEKEGKRPENGRKVAELLGWNYFDQGGGTAVLSKYPIVTNTPAKWGVLVRLPSGTEVWMFNAHLMHAPYQPYQLLGIPYGDGRFIKTAEEAVDESRKARGGQVERLIAELKPALASGKPVFLTGDMNEPSHQDWTERAARAGKVPIAVGFPSTLAFTKAGMKDAFRLIYPDEVAKRGNTWTPITSPEDPKDRHDRIDFVFVGETDVKVLGCEVVGEDEKFADILVRPYPSDHRGVVATVDLK